MSSPAVVALRCTVDRRIERIDRGEILYVTYGGALPKLARNGTQAVITAEAVTLYKGQEGMPVSVPIVVLGKTEVILNGKHQKLTLEGTNKGMPGTSLYYKSNAREEQDEGSTKITDNGDDVDANFLGTVVHAASPTTYSVDLIVNFAK